MGLLFITTIGRDSHSEIRMFYFRRVVEAELGGNLGQPQ